MKPSLTTPPLAKRKRITYMPNEYGNDFHEIGLKSQIHDLKQEVGILEERIAKLVAQTEAYHLLVQRHYSGKVKLQNKIRGVLKHVRDALSQTAIPGGKIKKPQNVDLDAVVQENKLLKWKLTIVEKFLQNSFPDDEFVTEDEDLTCSGTPKSKSAGQNAAC